MSHQDYERNVAFQFLTQNRPQHLTTDRENLISRCVGHLQERLQMPEARAQTVTMQVLGDVESRNHGAYLDLTLTTAYTLFLNDPAMGTSYALTVGDLLALARAKLNPAPSTAIH